MVMMTMTMTLTVTTMQGLKLTVPTVGNDLLDGNDPQPGKQKTLKVFYRTLEVSHASVPRPDAFVRRTYPLCVCPWWLLQTD
jgi:hypothetical protein